MESVASVWKREVRAELAAARSSLLSSLLGIPLDVLERDVVGEGLTTPQVLLLIGQEDAARASGMERVLAGDDPALTIPDSPQTTGNLNTALQQLLHARASLLSALARAPDDVLFRPLADETTVAAWIEESRDHDRVSSDRFSEWRVAHHLADGTGPHDLVIAALRAARKEVLTEIARVPEERRAEWAVGTRTLQRVLQGIVQWERPVAAAIAGEQRRALLEALPSESWHATWRSLHDDHHRLVRLAGTLSEDRLTHPVRGPWPGESTAYELLRGVIANDRQAAAAVRSSLSFTPSESRAAP